MFKHFTATVGALVFSLAALLFIGGMGLTRFQGLEGERTFYLYSKSSQAVITTEPKLWERGQIKGESISLSSSVSVEELLEEYSAKVLFTETAGDTLSYYCYTQKWTDGVRLGDYFVNLHIAVGEGRMTIGAPVIFGGF